MTILDSALPPPPPTYRRYLLWIAGFIITIAVFVAAFPDYLWYPFAYYKEIKTADAFIQEVAGGEMQAAYKTWKPSGSYTFQDFMEDWGPSGYYGPVRSYRLGRPEHIDLFERGIARRVDFSFSGPQSLRPEHIKNGSAAEIVLEVSPYQPFPANDPLRATRTKEVRLWVQFQDLSMTFPPE